MQSFMCKSCNTTWNHDEILPSLLLYGFINLVSQDDELIAFSCPETNCDALIVHKTKPGDSYKFHSTLNSHLDPSGTDPSGNASFKYLSLFPLPRESRNILTRFGVHELELTLWEYELGLDTEKGIMEIELGIDNKKGILEVDYYCSFNRMHLRAFRGNIQGWWYKKEDINKLFDIEKASRLRIFPRYMQHQVLIEKINHFYEDHYLQNVFTEDKSTSPFPTIDSWDKGKIARQYTFLELLTPPRDKCDLFVPRDERVVTYHHESNSIWKNFHQKYIQEQLSSQSELFIRDFLDLYAKTDFCFPKVESLVSRYRRQISAGLKSRRKREATQRHTLTELVSRVKKEAPTFDYIISDDEKVLRLMLRLNTLVRNNKKPFSILFTSETGTGKTMFGKAIHDASGRQGKFVRVNAAAIATSIFESELFGHKKGAFSGSIADREGLFKAADGGTLFFDEIGEIDLNLQVKLLTAIEEGVVMPLGSSVPVNVDVLMLFATNKNLDKAVEAGEFRQDLYYRINRFTYTIPPLRKRKNDIYLLANYFIEKHAVEKDDKNLARIIISEDAQKQLLSFKWPGNTRQLESVIEGILMLREPDDRSAISLEEVAGQLPENIIRANNRINKDDSHNSLNQANLDFDNIPNVQPAPGKRKMPDKDGIEQLLAYFLAKKGKAYGVIKKTANHIGVDQTNLSREIKKLGIKFP